MYFAFDAANFIESTHPLPVKEGGGQKKEREGRRWAARSDRSGSF